LEHSTLIKKLEFYGIRGIVRDLLSNYLTNREQYVTYRGASSTRSAITFGIPQGSVLGPLLFLVYINDIIYSSPLLNYILFADDTNLLMTARNCLEIMNQINPELDKLSCWFKANKLTLNVKKTSYMLFGNSKKLISDNDFCIAIDGVPILRVNEVKFLGVMLDDKLSWKSHINLIASKLARSIGVIYRARSVLNISLLRLLYSTMIHPHLNYCIVLWGGAAVTVIDKVVKLQKRAIRLICNAAYRAHTSPLFRLCNILKVNDLYNKELCLLMFKALHNTLPTSCAANFKRLPVRLYNTRLNSDFVQEFARTKARINSVQIAGPRAWNSLPVSLRSTDSIANFKSKLQNEYIATYISE
jgi:Reverse transcriptase (RNA-dependent DNA polymerase)